MGLKDRLMRYEGPILGLHFIEEYVMPGKNKDTPFYTCILKVYYLVDSPLHIRKPDTGGTLYCTIAPIELGGGRNDNYC